MDTTRRTRTTGLGRILATGLILSALLAAFPGPAQAAPAPRDGAPLAGLMSWLGGFLADLGFSSEGSHDDGPEAAFLPDGCNMDPGGSTCSKEVKTPVSAVHGREEGVPDRPATK